MSISQAEKQGSARVAVALKKPAANQAVDPALVMQASELANELQLPLLSIDQSAGAGVEFLLQVSADGLELLSTGAQAPGPVRVEFENPVLDYRIRNRVNSQAIARAVGVKPGLLLTVLDATAGLGKDSYLLASAGCQVQLLERDSIVHALLRDGLMRAQNSADRKVLEAVSRMQLSLDSLAHFVDSRPSFDVVYLDPMFPERRKSAQVKKDMFVLQKYFADSKGGKSEKGEESAMLQSALTIARRRVVVKRPSRAPELDNRKPTFSLTGRTSRYDVYITG